MEVHDEACRSASYQHPWRARCSGRRRPRPRPRRGSCRSSTLAGSGRTRPRGRSPSRTLPERAATRAASRSVRAACLLLCPCPPNTCSLTVTVNSVSQPASASHEYSLGEKKQRHTCPVCPLKQVSVTHAAHAVTQADQLTYHGTLSGNSPVIKSTNSMLCKPRILV